MKVNDSARQRPNSNIKVIEADQSVDVNQSLLSLEDMQNLIITQMKRRSSKIPQKGIRTRVMNSSSKDNDDF